MKRYRILLFFALPLAITGCSTTEDWSSKYPIETASSYASSRESALDIKDSLLALFSSEEIDALVQAALANNPDLQRSQARLEEVGFSLTRAKSSQIPSLSAGLSGRRADPVGGPLANTFSADLDASWEVDVWGRIRSNVRASKADLAAAEADFQSARQSLVGQTIQSWFDLVSAEKLRDLDTRRVASFESTEQLVSRRFDLGEATSTSLHLARADLENARADLESSINRRDQAARRLNALTGSYPNSGYTGTVDWPDLNATVAEGLPSELLTARPDIVAAFERVRAAEFRTSLAQADIFPSFRLTANGGRTSSVLEDLSDSAFNSWSALAALTVNLFDAGERRANTGAADKRAEQAYYSYQSIVLNALREVENALGSESYLAREESARQAALEAARSSLARAQRDYETGLISILSLLETQRRVFSTERQVINLKAARLNNRVSLALALGKGV